MIDLVEVESGNVPEEGPGGRQSSAGELLASARKKKSMKLEAVADRLKLSVSTIQALESGDMQNLPPRSFVQGYIRAYAKLVELDVQVILPLWSKEFPCQAPESSAVSEPNNRHLQRMRRSMSRSPQARKRQKRTWIMVSIVVAIMAVFGLLSTLDKPKLTSNHVLPQLPHQAAISDRSQVHTIPVLAKSTAKS